MCDLYVFRSIRLQITVHVLCFSLYSSLSFESNLDISSFLQDSTLSQPRDHAGNGSVFVNEAALAGGSINNRHVHHKRNDPSAHNCLNTLLARSNSRQPPVAKTPHGLQHSQGWVMETGYLYNPAGRLGLQHTTSGKNIFLCLIECKLQTKKIR